MQQWLSNLLDQMLPEVANLPNTPAGHQKAQAWAIRMKAAWADHGFAELKQQRNLMTNVRNVLKNAPGLGKDHFILDYMNFSSAEWTEMNRSIAQNAARQNENQVILSPEQVNALVTRATNLLLSREWYEIAAALAVLTGRRSTEVLKTAQFTWETEFSVLFTGALKRRGEQALLTFEIPTLCQAQYVVKALDKLREMKPTEHLTEAQVNRFSGQVAKACEDHFGDIIPPPAGRENLYSHLFRRIYATIATYFYCPPNVDEAEFRAQIQGHFSGHEHLSLAERRVIQTDRHYRSHVIQDDHGNRKQGIRLSWQGVQVLKAFQPSETVLPESTSEQTERTEQSKQSEQSAEHQDVAMTKLSTTTTTHSKTARPELKKHDIERMLSLMAQRGVVGSTAQVFHELLNEFEVKLEERAQTQAPPSLEAFNWFTKEIDTLRAENTMLKQQLQQTQHSEAAEAEIQSLRAKLKEAEQMLAYFRAPFLQSPEPRSNAQFASAIPVTIDKPQPAPASAPAPAPVVAATSRQWQADAQGAEVDPVVVQAIRAIINYNNQAQDNAQRWAISIPALKSLLKTKGRATQPKINAARLALQTEIDQHHQKYGLGERHNRIHQGQDITQFIQF